MSDGTETKIEELLKELGSKEAYRRERAAMMLAKLKVLDERVISAMKIISTQDPNEYVRLVARNALRSFEQIPPELSRTSEEGTDELSRDTLHTLEQIPPAGEVTLLERQSQTFYKLSPTFDWFFLLQWVLATTVGLIIGLFGIASGVLQWLVLRQRIPKAHWWILATIVGNYLTYLGINFVSLFLADLAEGGGGSTGGEIFVIIIAVGSGGTFIGVLQWLVLRRYVLQAGWWILVSTLSFTLSSFLVFFGEQAAFSLFIQSTTFILPGVVGGLISGVMTGIVLVWLLRHPHPRGQIITGEAHSSIKSKPLLIGLAIGAVIIVAPLMLPGLLSIMLGWSRVNINSEYVADNSAEGVVHNYWLAIQRQDYNKAYNYLSDSIESKPDFDHFAVEVDRSSGDRRNTLQIREIRLKQDDLAEIDLHLENYTSTSYGTDNDTIYLQLESNGDGWKIVEFTRPYWNYDWNEPGREVVISQAIELDPDNASLYYERGKIYANEDNYKQAQTDFDKVIELDPAYTAAYSARGDVYAHYEDYQLAIANYNKAIELKPNGDLYVRRGSAYYASGNREQASLDFSKAVELASTPVIGHNNVAWALAYDLDTNYETALEHALRSVELDPQAYNHDTLALVYYKLKQYEKAVEHYDISLSLDAEYVGSYKRRGDAYLALGNKQAALTDYQTYVAKSKWPPRSDRTAVEIIIRSLQED